MDAANSRENIDTVGGEYGEAHVKDQYSPVYNQHTSGRPPLRTSSKSSPIFSAFSVPDGPAVPNSAHSDASNKISGIGPKPRNTERSASNDSYRSVSSSPSHLQNMRQRPSEASRLRVLSSTSAPLLTDSPNIPEVHSPDDFLAKRQPSLKGGEEVPRSTLKSSSTFPLQAHDDATARNGFPLPSRDRGRSTSSSRSTSAFSSVPLRPSISIPDYGSAELVYSRQRNFSNYSSYRPGRGFTDSSSVASYRREPNSRANGIESEEVRASFRSALTINSSFLGTNGTERSSVLTKSSSATSIYGRDEGMSVDDAIGMYENGFADSGPEDGYASRPDSSLSNRSSQFKDTDMKIHTLDIPKSSHFIIRDSAAIFEEPKGLFDGVDGAVLSSEFLPTSGLGRRVENQKTDATDMAPSHQFTASSSPFDESRDRYGFRKKSQYVALDQYNTWNRPYTEYLARRRKKWVALLKDSGLSADKPSSFPPRSSKVKRFIRKGIPPDWRGAAWFFYAGGPEIVARHHGLYKTLVQKAADGEVSATDEEIIERDLNRTFPDNIRFKPDPKIQEGLDADRRNSVHTIIELETPILQSLRRVLQAFSIHNPRIGYCQSLNFLAGLLLLFMDEEKSFWLLNIITQEYLPGTHAVNLEGANVDLGVLMTSIKESMPSIWAKIGGELDGSVGSSQVSMRLPPITLCLSAWFMSCFIGNLPTETTLRVWDSFFYEGSKTLFRIALAIFKVGEPDIRAVTDPMEIFQVVQTIPRRLVDANGLMEACFKRRNGFGHLSQETIDARRAERRRGYAEERARAAGEVLVERKGTIFSRRRGKARTIDAL